jgi:nucleoside-diphosphate kinase
MGEVIARIERTFLRLADLQMRHKTLEWCKQHYANVADEPFFSELVNFMTSRPILGFVVSGPLAIYRMRAMVGPTRSWEAAPGTIRGDYGYYPAMLNCIHVADSQLASEREFGYFHNPSTDLKELNDAGDAMS